MIRLPGEEVRPPVPLQPHPVVQTHRARGPDRFPFRRPHGLAGAVIKLRAGCFEGERLGLAFCVHDAGIAALVRWIQGVAGVFRIPVSEMRARGRGNGPHGHTGHQNQNHISQNRHDSTAHGGLLGAVSSSQTNDTTALAYQAARAGSSHPRR